MLSTSTERQANILEIVRERRFRLDRTSCDAVSTSRSKPSAASSMHSAIRDCCGESMAGVSLPVQNQNLAYGSRQGLNADAKQRIAHATATVHSRRRVTHDRARHDARICGAGTYPVDRICA